MTEAKKGAPPCGLYIKIGPDLAMDVLTRDLKSIFFVLNRSPYERNMHALEIRGDATDADFREKAAACFEFARANGVVGIWRGAVQDAQELGAEGVLVATPEELPAARAAFGQAGIFGLACGTSNELAAQAHDADVDFVSFATSNGALPGADVLRFWTILSDKPALIEGPVTNDYAAYYVQAGATFLDAGDYIFSHGKGVMQGTVNMLHAIELALEAQAARPH